VAAVILALGLAAWLRNSDYRTVRAMWEDVVAKRPRARALVNLGWELSRQGEHEKALRSGQLALNMDPKELTAYLEMAFAYEGLDRPDDAIASYRQALALGPTRAETYFTLGCRLEEAGQRAEATAMYRDAVRLDAHHFGAHTNLGRTLLSEGRIDE